MKYTELTHEILKGEKKLQVVEPVTQEDFDFFNELLSIDDSTKNDFDCGDNANGFFKAYPDIKKAIGAERAANVFYARKLGYSCECIPNKLMFLLMSAIKEYNGTNTPNLILERVGTSIRQYANVEWKNGESIFTFKDVLDNAFGRSVNIITEYNSIVTNGDFTELYVENVDRVAVLSKDIGSLISYDDARNVRFDVDNGLMLGEYPLRCFKGRLGITMDEFDLRECI